MERAEVHLWRVDLARHPDAIPPLEQTLGREERVRAGRFRLKLDHDRYVLAHGAVRAILAGYLNTTPAELAFRDTWRGKPELVARALRFNLSHSHDLALLAVGLECQVGIDVERLGADIPSGLTACLSRQAQELLDRLRGLERRVAFYRGWTRMEAVIKASGQDLELGLRTFEHFLTVGRSVVFPPATPATHPYRWWLHDLSPRKGYVGALATEQLVAPPGWRQWRPAELEPACQH